MSDIINIENISFKYPPDRDGAEKQVLSGIDLNIERGSFVAVIGTNGSGKSTLAKHLNGLLIPTEGTVHVEGYDTKDQETIWDVRQKVGMVFQNPDNQIVSSIVEDDVAFGPENMGIPSEEIRERVDESLTNVNMGAYKRKAPHMLSGGQKQRIAIAGAIAMKPDCIVFDEPTAMLDPSGRKDVISIIEQLNEEGITTILITHFMEEAARADRILIVHKGKVVMDDAPKEIFKREDDLELLGLDIPMAVKIAKALREKGLDVPEDIVSEQELAEFIQNKKDNAAITR